jgi:hypothetical protein
MRALVARSREFLSLPNCAPKVFVHARRHGFVVLIDNVFAYRFRVDGRSIRGIRAIKNKRDDC